ncbi:pyridoxamine 5'-phosphate oxidase family protein [Cytophagaceae bacterium DM2B3-1]|uniref:Pyridoxamine 5'-phosphate oxidase family protein n=1 Tax=Xanthocytophaga flava TaxID=3048013 RepID=A0ABT7CT73_9BACT|nr:pyridoxamine 5'-phosphate oxidase family protein [Xanthocytophaga flavus]MDJ1496871.1 pyridoxamine 5'-phosphate oxidase family protein [Xanthocytophaga flavus]
MLEIFHQGEREIQNRVGESLIADRNKPLISNSIVRGAIHFIDKQPMAIVGSRNKENELWASLLIGNFGFVKVSDPGTIVFDTEQITSNPSDIFFSNIAQNNQIGSLFIELDSRKRYRVNGTCQINNSRIELSVKQAYPNCPKYIQRRIISTPDHFKKVPSSIVEGSGLTAQTIQWITNADTFFVASADSDGNLDASHRGGNTNFIEITPDGLLKIPDYPGNSLFNTLGNILANPNVGLLFIDFERKQTLQLTGSASLLFGQNTETDLLKTKGTCRYWLFHTSRWIHTINHHQVEWEFLEYSPFNS